MKSSSLVSTREVRPFMFFYSHQGLEVATPAGSQRDTSLPQNRRWRIPFFWRWRSVWRKDRLGAPHRTAWAIASKYYWRCSYRGVKRVQRWGKQRKISKKHIIKGSEKWVLRRKAVIDWAKPSMCGFCNGLGQPGGGSVKDWLYERAIALDFPSETNNRTHLPVTSTMRI